MSDKLFKVISVLKNGSVSISDNMIATAASQFAFQKRLRRDVLTVQVLGRERDAEDGSQVWNIISMTESVAP
jgi:hypothetical protein